MNLFKRNSLGFHLLQRAFGAYVLVAIVVTILQLWSEYEITRDRVDSEILYQESVFARSLENAVWHLDAAQIQSITAGIIRSPVVSGVDIIDLEGKWLYRGGMIDDAAEEIGAAGILSDIEFDYFFRPQLLHHQFTLYDNQPTFGKGKQTPEPLAEVHFYLDHAVVIEEVEQSLLMIVLVALVKTAALWIIFLLFIQKIVSRPLAALTQRFVELSPSRPLTESAMATTEILPEEAAELIHLKQATNDLAAARMQEEQYKRELTELNQSLEQQVEARTAELRMEHQSTRAIIESMDDGLLVLDQDGRIKQLNPRLEQLIGSSGQALQGHSLQALFGEEGESDGSLMERLQQEGLYEQRELQQQREGGRTVPVQLAASLLYSSEQQVAGAVVVVHDLSDRMKMEQREQYAAYQSGISETGAAVMHTMGNALGGLTAKIYDLKRKTEGFEQIRGAVHKLLNRYEQEEIDAQDLHQGMQVINSALGKVSGEDSEDNGIRGVLDRLERQIGDVGRLIHNYDDVSKMRFEPVRFNLLDMIEDVVSMSRARFGLREITVDIDCPSGLMLELNRNSVVQMLSNLLGNSVEAIVVRRDNAPEYAGLIRIEVKERAEKRVEISISDNGCGLEQEQQERVFAAGFTTKVLGHGQGMHAAGNFVSTMGGKISFHSDGVDRGATVHLLLPLSFNPSKK